MECRAVQAVSSGCLMEEHLMEGQHVQHVQQQQQHSNHAKVKDDSNAQPQQPQLHQQQQEEQAQCQQQAPGQQRKPSLLQLPARALAAIAGCLRTRDALKLACQVLPKDAPDAAAAVLSGVTKADISCQLGATQPVLARLQHLKELNLRVWLQPNTPPDLSNLASLAQLSRITLDTVTASLSTHGGLYEGVPPGHAGLACCQDGTCLPSLKEQRHAELLQQLGQLAVTGPYSSSLKSLTIIATCTGFTLSDQTFAPLSRLTGLQDLSLRYTRSARHLGLAALSTLTQLTSITLAELPLINDLDPPRPQFECGVKDLAAAGLLQQLHSFSLQSAVASAALVPSLTFTPALLTALTLVGCPEFFPAFTQQLVQLTNLQFLQASQSVGLSESDLAAFAPVLTQLTLLDIPGARLKRQGQLWGDAALLSSLTNLKALGLASCRLGGAALDTVALLTQLTQLAIGGSSPILFMPSCHMDCGDLAKLSAIAGLKCLHVAGLPEPKLQLWDWKQLAKLSGLTELTLRHCKAYDTHVEWLQRKLPQLKKLDVDEVCYIEGTSEPEQQPDWCFVGPDGETLFGGFYEPELESDEDDEDYGPLGPY